MITDIMMLLCDKRRKPVLMTINNGIEVKKIIPNKAILSVDFQNLPKKYLSTLLMVYDGGV